MYSVYLFLYRMYTQELGNRETPFDYLRKQTKRELIWLRENLERCIEMVNQALAGK